MKRIVIATLLGMVFGLVCYYMAKSGGDPIPASLRYQIIFSRTLIGFAIGISSLNMKHWALHGLVMGLIFSLPLAFSSMMGASEEFSTTMMFSMTFIMGGIYGIIIELVTTVLFKAKQA